MWGDVLVSLVPVGAFLVTVQVVRLCARYRVWQFFSSSAGDPRG